jgi:hypothetical protein
VALDVCEAGEDLGDGCRHGALDLELQLGHLLMIDPPRPPDKTGPARRR